MSRTSYWKPLKEPARQMRREMTDAEHFLWRRIRPKQVEGVQFYRQRPINRFVVDFFGPSANLVLEVDGAQHAASDHRIRDAERDQALEQLGLRTLRFSNTDVLTKTDQVIEEIRRAIQKAQTTKI